MDFSLSDFAIAIATAVLMPWAIGRVALRFIPHIQIFFDTIELGKKVLNFIGEAPEWINYNENLEQSVESLNEVMKTLLAVAADVQQEVQLLEFQRQLRTRREVENWMGNVARRKAEVENLVRHVEQTGAVSRFLYRAWLGSCVENKKKDLRQLYDHKTAFQGRLAINDNRVGRERLVTSELVGGVAAQKVEEIWGNLTSQGVTILGVEGDRGVGKTTTMMHIYNRIVDTIPSSFDNVFYVSVQEGDKVRQLQSAIISKLSLQDLEDEDDEIRRAARIYRALKLTRRFVLIFDGLMLPFDLHKVGIPRFEECGGKLVVVAHALSQRVCQKMGCRSRTIVRVNALRFKDARELFMYTLRPSHDLSPEIEVISNEIVQRCNGVPKKIREVAVSLRNIEDEICTWRTTLNEM